MFESVLLLTEKLQFWISKLASYISCTLLCRRVHGIKTEIQSNNCIPCAESDLQTHKAVGFN